MVKIAVVSLYTPNIRNLGDYMVKTVQPYCNEHGYDFICAKNTLDKSRHPVWSKILILLQVIKTGKYDWVFWIDADALIMNHNILIENIIENYTTNDTLVIATKDRNGFNAGILLLKVSDKTITLLEDVYSEEKFITYQYKEQESLKYFLEESGKYNNALTYIPKKTMNSYFHPYCNGYYTDGDFILHLAGYKYRAPYLMKKYSNNRTLLAQREKFILLFQIILASIIIILIFNMKGKIWPKKILGITGIIILLFLIFSAYFFIE